MNRASTLRRILAPVGALVLSALALFALWLNRPDSRGADSSVFEWPLVALPFVLLIVVAARALASSSALGRTLEGEWSLLDRLRTDPAGMRAVILGPRPSVAPDAAADRGVTVASPRETFSARLAVDPRDSAVASALDGVLRRREAGEEFSVATLREDLAGRAADLTARLHFLHLAAFGVGLAGTVFGLVLQLKIAGAITGGGLISDAFLNGILLKASCTFVGLCVGWYAFALRESIARELDAVGEALEAFVCLELGPALSRNQTASDPIRLVEHMVEEMRPILLGVADAIHAGVDASVRAAAERLRAAVMADLTNAINLNLLVPFATEMNNVVMRLKGIEDKINDASTGIRAVGDAFTANLTGTGIALEHLMQQITTAGAAAQAVVGELQAVRLGFAGVAEQVRPLRDELVSTVETLRHVPSPGLQKDVVADLVQLSEMVYRTLGAVNGSRPERSAR